MLIYVNLISWDVSSSGKVALGQWCFFGDYENIFIFFLPLMGVFAKLKMFSLPNYCLMQGIAFFSNHMYWYMQLYRSLFWLVLSLCLCYQCSCPSSQSFYNNFLLKHQLFLLLNSALNTRACCNKFLSKTLALALALISGFNIWTYLFHNNSLKKLWLLH